MGYAYVQLESLFSSVRPIGSRRTFSFDYELLTRQLIR